MSWRWRVLSSFRGARTPLGSVHTYYRLREKGGAHIFPEMQPKDRVRSGTFQQTRLCLTPHQLMKELARIAVLFIRPRIDCHGSQVLPFSSWIASSSSRSSWSLWL